MVGENISQEIRLKNIDVTRNYLIEEMNRNELISKKHENVCTTLNYIEHFLFLGSIIAGYISITAFASLVGIPIGITSFVTGLKVCAITAAIEKYKSMIKKKKKKHHKIVLLPKSKLNSTKVLIYAVLIHSAIIHDEFASINNVLKEYSKMREEIKKIKSKI